MYASTCCQYVAKGMIDTAHTGMQHSTEHMHAGCIWYAPHNCTLGYPLQTVVMIELSKPTTHTTNEREQFTEACAGSLHALRTASSPPLMESAMFCLSMLISGSS
jgi:hypothetical protein